MRVSELTLPTPDYTLNNPDTLIKYKDAGAITQKVPEASSRRWEDDFRDLLGLCEIESLLEQLQSTQFTYSLLPTF